MATAVELSKPDLEFLVGLDKKLNITRKVTLGPGEPNRFCKGYRKVTIKEPAKEKMTKKEAEEMLELLKKNSEELIIYPQDGTSMGFYPCFTISTITRTFPGIQDEEKRLLEFEESQLPKEYNFKTLAGYFMKPRNIELAKLVGITNISDNKINYEY